MHKICVDFTIFTCIAVVQCSYGCTAQLAHTLYPGYPKRHALKCFFKQVKYWIFFLHTVWASSITMPQVSMRLSLMLLDASMQCHAACLCVWVCVVCDCSLFVYGLGTFVAVGCRFKYILQARRHTPHILRHCRLVKPYPAYMLWIATYTALSSSLSALLCFAARTASNTFRKTIVVQNFQLDDAIERIVSPNDDGLCACRHRRQCVEHTFVMHVGKGDDATDPTPPYST